MSVVTERFNPLKYVAPSRVATINRKFAQNILQVQLSTVDLESLPVGQAVSTGEKLRSLQPENPVFVMGKTKPNDRTRFTIL
jgi:hypothetical protein